MLKVLEPLEHSVLDHADPAGQHAVIQDVLEPLEHSVLDTVLDSRPMEGAPVLEPIEHSVLEKPLDDEPKREKFGLEPLEHSVLLTALHGVHMEGRQFWNQQSIRFWKSSWTVDLWRGYQRIWNS